MATLITTFNGSGDFSFSSTSSSSGSFSSSSSSSFSSSGDGFILNASGNNNTLTGGSGNDTINASGGNSTLSGGGGNDTINAGSGNDILDGGTGNDILTGGTGTDVLTGGLGNDVFKFNSVSDSTPGLSRDVIKDFVGNGNLPGDRIDLSTIDANSNIAGNQAFTFIGAAAFSAPGQVRYSGGILQGNTAGNLSPEFEIQLVRTPLLVTSDIIL
ncbi:calcium-binding protein [Nostoc sp.]|uniref:calcium-binding protein n=1 Tax=Nostoc sp. TaxID=1180 RepID=UPI002FF4C05B